METGSVRRRLLLVDDDAAHLRLLARALEEATYEIETAASGEAALEAASRTAPNLVLLDVDLPGIDGFETCRRLKLLAEMQSTPVIFISGIGDRAQRLDAFAAGAVDFVSKPFDIAEVRARVATHLELAGLRQRAEQQSRELAASLAKLEELEHFRHDLVHMVAHDMRSPLMAVSGYLELLDLEGEKLAEDHREFVAQAADGARTLVRLIDAMLDTDRLEVGKLPLDLADCDLRANVDLAIASLGPASARRVTVDIQPPGRVAVRADGEILRRVLANLLANGLRNSDERQPVQLVVARRANAVRVEIHDRGPEIPAEFRPRVFEKYARRSGSRSRERRAVGLGLPFSKLATEAHGGRIDFESGPEGTTFWLELPVREAPPNLS